MKRGLVGIKDKKAQFYLLAAIVIIAIILGFSAVSNYAKKEENLKVYDLGEEIGIEIEEVLDYGVYNASNSAEFDNIIGNFITDLSSYPEITDTEVFFIFGGSAEVTLITYDEYIAGSISFGGTIIELTGQGEIEETYTPSPGEDTVTLIINEITYEFDLREGENFYFILSKEDYVFSG